MELLGGGRYRSLVPIRCRGAIHFYSGRDPETDRACVVVMAPRLPPREARTQLGSLARLHRLVAGAHVPAVLATAVDGPEPWVALDCDAVADHEHTVDFVRHGGDKPDYERGAALGKQLMEALARCHQLRDPLSDRPICLGSLSAGNLLFSADGRVWIVGFGACPLNEACIAPEVAAGAPATPGADVFAMTLFLRAQLGFVTAPPEMQRVFAGQPLAGDAELVRLLMWSNTRILAASPPERPDMDQTLEQARLMWKELGITPDVDGMHAWTAHAIAGDPERLADAPRDRPTPGIRLGHDGDWLETPNGMRHSLGARRPLRRLLLALATARRERVGAALSVEELLHAGWPGEEPLPEAGNNRVYVAISTLRKLGLGEHLQRWDGGYRIDPGISCQF